MTKIEELASIEAELLLLERQLQREREISDATLARLAVLDSKKSKLWDRLKAVQRSMWA